MTGLGALVLAVGWLRKLARPRRELLYARTLRPGEALRIRLLQAGDPVEGDSPEIEVSG